MDVDVVIIARNEEKFLPLCLDSLKSQDYGDGSINIFVVDNNSTDNTKRVAEEKGVQVLSCAGRSPAILRNRGIELGVASAVAFLDAHCVPKKDWLSRMTSALSIPSIGGVQGSTVWCDESGSVLSESLATARLHGSIYGSRSVLPWILTGNALYRRVALEKVHGFTENLIRCEDTDLSWKILLKGYYLAYQESAILTHYERRGMARSKTIFLYGRGASALKRRYAFLGVDSNVTRKFRQALKLYRLGYYYGSMIDFVESYTPSVDKSLRPWFRWDERREVRISLEVVAWFLGDRWIVKTADYQEQIVMDKSAAAIWECLLKKRSRLELEEDIRVRYHVSVPNVEDDIESFIDSLSEEKIIEFRTFHHEMSKER